MLTARWMLVLGAALALVGSTTGGGAYADEVVEESEPGLLLPQPVPGDLEDGTPIEATFGACDGPNPTIAQLAHGIEIRGHFDCIGSFDTHKTCMRLQWWNGSKWRVISPYQCSRETASKRAYKGVYWRCAAVGEGTYRAQMRHTVYHAGSAYNAKRLSPKLHVCD